MNKAVTVGLKNFLVLNGRILVERIVIYRKNSTTNNSCHSIIS